MTLGEPDSSGRRKPIPVEGSEKIIDVDFVAVAIGRKPNSIVQGFTKGIGVKDGGIIITEDETTQTSHKGIYAGGDIATGEATVISAIGFGKKPQGILMNIL